MANLLGPDRRGPKQTAVPRRLQKTARTHYSYRMQLCHIVRVYAVIMKGGPSVTVEREELRRLVDELPENELNAARRYLEFIRDVGKDPVRFALENAAPDDEPETVEERERAERADEDFMAGQTTSMDELKRELGCE